MPITIQVDPGWEAGFDISYSALSASWAAAAWNVGMRVCAVDLWTGGYQNNAALQNLSGPSLMVAEAQGFVLIGYINANPPWGTNWDAPAAMAHAILNAGAAWAKLKDHGFVAIDIEIAGTTWDRVQALYNEVRNAGIPASRIFFYTGGWFINGYIGNPPEAIRAGRWWTTGALITFVNAPYGGILPSQIVGCQLGETTDGTPAVQYDYDRYLSSYFKVGAAPPPPPPPGGTVTTYTVQSGDSAGAIAAKFNISLQQLEDWNGGSGARNWSLIYAGETFVVSAPAPPPPPVVVPPTPPAPTPGPIDYAALAKAIAPLLPAPVVTVNVPPVDTAGLAKAIADLLRGTL